MKRINSNKYTTTGALPVLPQFLIWEFRDEEPVYPIDAPEWVLTGSLLMVCEYAIPSFLVRGYERPRQS